MTPAADPPTPTKPMPPACEVRNWRVFGVGLHNGHLVSPERAAALARNFAIVSRWIEPKVGLGHDTKRQVQASLGLPNAGKITAVRADENGQVWIDLGNVPTWVGGYISSGRYDDGSVEINEDFRNPETQEIVPGPYITRVAILGLEHGAYRETDNPVATFPDGTPVPPLYDPMPLTAEAANAGLTFRESPDRTPYLCFSEAVPMTPDQMRQSLLALGFTDDDLAGMTHEEVKQAYEASQNQAGDGPAQFAEKKKQFADRTKRYADHMAKKFGSDGLRGSNQAGQIRAMNSNGDLGSNGDGGAGKPEWHAEAEGLKKRLFAAEAALTDMQKKGDQSAAESAQAFAERVVRQHANRFPARKLMDLAVAEGVAVATAKKFSDGGKDHAGADALKAWEASIAALPVHYMFAERIDATPAPNAPMTPFQNLLLHRDNAIFRELGEGAVGRIRQHLEPAAK